MELIDKYILMAAFAAGAVFIVLTLLKNYRPKKKVSRALLEAQILVDRSWCLNYIELGAGGPLTILHLKENAGEGEAIVSFRKGHPSSSGLAELAIADIVKFFFLDSPVDGFPQNEATTYLRVVKIGAVMIG